MDTRILKICYEKLVKFCVINGFTLIGNNTLKKYGMRSNIVYSTSDNFVGIPVYPENMPLLIENGVWEKLILINNELMKEHGKRLVIYDAFRPREVQEIFWDIYYAEHGRHDETLVANPKKRGTHNITINAIDMILENVDGSPVELPSNFDDMSEKANIYYDGCSEEAKKNRDLLINIARKYGLIVNEDEWWHFIDERILKYGMRGNYSKTKLVPKMERKVFKLPRENKVKRLVRKLFT